jgi:hypothetical protein
MERFLPREPELEGWRPELSKGEEGVMEGADLEAEREWERPGAEVEEEASDCWAWAWACSLRKALNSPGASSGWRVAGTQSELRVSPSDSSEPSVEPG